MKELASGLAWMPTHWHSACGRERPLTSSCEKRGTYFHLLPSRNCLHSATANTRFSTPPCPLISPPCSSIFLGFSTTPVFGNALHSWKLPAHWCQFSGLGTVPGTVPTTSTCWQMQQPELRALDSQEDHPTLQVTTNYDEAVDWFLQSSCELPGNVQTFPLINSTWSQFQGCPYIEPKGLCGGGTGVRVSSPSPGGLGSAPRALNTERHFPQYMQASHRAVKKAYLRAMDRLRRTGRTVYGGRSISAQPDFPRLHQRTDTKQHRRIKFASWNAGGLSSDLMAETFVWAERQGLACLILQETHWSQTRGWRQDGWLCIHSAAGKPKQGGVMVCLRSSDTSLQTVRWNELVAGRGLHVCAEVLGQQLDILAVYHLVRWSGLLVLAMSWREICADANRSGGPWIGAYLLCRRGRPYFWQVI